LIGAIAALSLAGGLASGRVLFRPVDRVSQPIAFNHFKHVEDLGLECDTCHEFYTSGRHAGLPTLTTCLGCHEEPQTEEPEEQKIRDLAADGHDDVFRKRFKLADDAFYSHRRHAALGEIACATCHGSIAETTSSPAQQLVRISMDFCVDCHERSEIRSDCTTCHR
jgi:hypothetical protein